MRDLLTITAIALAIGAGAIALANVFSSASCTAQWEDSGFKHNYSLLGGCRLQLTDGTWIPAANYRGQ